MKYRANLVDAMVLVVIGAFVYLPLMHKTGFTHDDWYLMYAAGADGASVFSEIYSGDRPLRAYVLGPAFELFGQNVLYYNLSGWVFRIISAWAFLWLLRILWRDKRSWTLLMAGLYLLYPGFLSQLNGVDYLPQMVSLVLAMFSLGLTAHTYFQKNTLYKWMGVSLSILFGIAYLGLVEYEAGFEIMRLGILVLLVSRKVVHFSERAVLVMKSWSPYSLVMIGFGFWRVFLFEGNRRATDISFQLEGLLLYPLQTIYRWTVQVVQDFFDVTISAYVIPLSQLTNYIQRWGGILTIIMAGAAILGFDKFHRNHDSSESETGDFVREVLWLGIFTSIGGLIPIAMVNREVYYPSFSRYALMSSFGVAMVVSAFLIQARGRSFRNSLLAGLLLISTLTHHANAVKSTEATQAINNFWWQVSWRVPQFEKNTTILANYPSVASDEDYFVWGPANLVYYPESQNDNFVQPALFAVLLNKDTVQKVLTRERQEFNIRRGIRTYANYRNIIILSQPTPQSCVHVLDGSALEFSSSELDSIRIMGEHSEIEHILMGEAVHTPPSRIFGPEPEHGWCFFYQQADLARQRGDWETVLRLGNEARKIGLFPSDTIEWMPFLQAYAAVGDYATLMKLAPEIRANRYISLQACRILSGMDGLSDRIRALIDAEYCLE